MSACCDPGLAATLACLWEATARKAGNVHRERGFADLGYVDFLNSAAAIGPVFVQASTQRVGTTILQAITATRRVVRSNTNLGIVLLIAPLAAVPGDVPLSLGIEAVLEGLNLDDARDAVRAIQRAQPGGMGEVAEQDVSQEPTLPLRELMALAQERDLIARQYVNGFHEVLNDGVPALTRFLQESEALEPAIVRTHLHWMARYPDSLIARKRGLAVAEEAARRASAVLHKNASFAEFDAWLRADGNARNPGTSADLTTACLFAALREGIITLPLARPFLAE